MITDEIGGRPQQPTLTVLNHLIFFLVPMMVFNTFGPKEYTIQVIPLLMLAVCIGDVLGRVKLAVKIPRLVFPIAMLLPVVGLNLIRTLDGIVFIVAGKLAVAMVMAYYVYSIRRQLRTYLETYYLALVVSVAYAAYQYLIRLLGLDAITFLANLPVWEWYELGWHQGLERGGMSRLQGFAFEPAYLTMFVTAGILSLVAFPRKNSRLLFFVFMVGLLLSFSRNGQAFAIYFLFGVLCLRRLPRVICWMLPLAVVVFPVVVSVAMFAGGRGLDADLSTLARLLPIYVFAVSATSEPAHFLFGVPDYPTFITSHWPPAVMGVLASEGVEVAPMSLVGFFLYNFGVVGLSLFVFAVTYILRKSKAGLFCFSGFLLVIFNIGSIFWPVTWIMLAVAYYSERRQFSRLIGLPRRSRRLVPNDDGIVAQPG